MLLTVVVGLDGGEVGLPIGGGGEVTDIGTPADISTGSGTEETLGGESITVVGGRGNDTIAGGGANDTVVDDSLNLTPEEEDELIRLITEEGVPIPLPEFEEPELLPIPEEQIVVQEPPPNIVRPAVVSRPPVRVPPGTRLVSPSQMTPTRVALSEGSGDNVYGTAEEEQQPVWNIRSLKLRRALRI